MEQADEEKLLEDAIAALDRLLEEVGCLKNGHSYEDVFLSPQSILGQQLQAHSYGGGSGAAQADTCACLGGDRSVELGHGGREGCTSSGCSPPHSHCHCPSATFATQLLLPCSQQHCQHHHCQQEQLAPQQQQQQQQQSPDPHSKWKTALHSALLLPVHGAALLGENNTHNRLYNHLHHLHPQPHSAPSGDRSLPEPGGGGGGAATADGGGGNYGDVRLTRRMSLGANPASAAAEAGDSDLAAAIGPPPPQQQQRQQQPTSSSVPQRSTGAQSVDRSVDSATVNVSSVGGSAAVGRFRVSSAAALRRRSSAYLVTPEQDEALARAIEKARRMSDTVNASGDLVLSMLAANRVNGRSSLQVEHMGAEGACGGGGGGAAGTGTTSSIPRVLSRGLNGSRRLSNSVVAANTQLLNDLVDEALANRPEDFPKNRQSGTGIRGSSTAMSGTRTGDARGGGGGGGGGGGVVSSGANVVDKSLAAAPHGGGGGGGGLGTEQGLMLWTGNKSRVERARLAVRLLQATDLSRTKEDKQIDPYAVVSCEGQSYTSKAVMKSKDPFWDEFFVFDVPQPAFAELKVKVYDHLRCWRPVFMGQVRVPVKSVAEFPARYSQPAWHQMRSRAGKLKGQVQMQLFYTAEWVHRALNVLACTWNVGNAEPPQDLSPWLQGVEALQHDLVAIGVQECLYKVGAGAMDPANQMMGEEYGMGGAFIDEGAPPYDVYTVGGTHGGTDSNHNNNDCNGRGSGNRGDSREVTTNGFVVQTASTYGNTNTPQGPGHKNGYVNGFTHRSSNENDNNGMKAPWSYPPDFLDSGSQLLDSLAQRGAPNVKGVLPPQTPVKATAAAVEQKSNGASPIGGTSCTLPTAAAAAAAAAANLTSGPHGAHQQLSVLVTTGGSGGFPSAAVSSSGITTANADMGGPESGTADRVTPASGMAIRESSTTGPAQQTSGSAAPTPSTVRYRRLPPRGRTQQSLIIPTGTLPSANNLIGAADGRPCHNGGAPHLHLPPPRAAASAVARRRNSIMEPNSSQQPGLNRVVSMAARWPPHTAASIAAGGAPDASFTSSLAAVPPSGASVAAFTRPSLSSAQTGAANGAAAAAVPLRSSGTPGKAVQQTYKSKGVLTDMAKVGGEFRDLWEERLKEAVGPGYFMVASTHMGQIRLLLFARNDVYAAISDVRTSKQATGVAGVATNKGGVGISLRVWETTIAFINSHLAAHQDRTRARNNNYRDIIRGLKLDGQGSHMDALTAFHHVIWVGDLNYRLDYGQQATNPTESPNPADFAALVSDVQQGDFAKLLEMDQLRREMGAKRAFLGFHEGPINFEPSFKVLRRRGCEYNPQRSPAYCDRILYRSNLPLKQIRAVSYYSPCEIATSDHKPVGAILVVPTVWRTTVENETAGGGGGGRSGLSGNLAASEWGFGSLYPMSRGVHTHPHQKPHAQVRLIFTLLRAHGLFMLRSRRRSTVSASTEFPSPQLLLSGPCMRESVVRSRVAPQTREPLWADVEHAGLGPLVLELKSASLAEMAHFRLWVRVFDLRGAEKATKMGAGGGGAAAGGGGGSGGGGKSLTGGGGRISGGGGKGEGGTAAAKVDGTASASAGAAGNGNGSVLARGVLPLLDAVTSLLQDSNGLAHFKVMLELHGLPAGTLEGNMRLEVVERAKALERTHGSARTALYEISESFGTRGSGQQRRSGGGFGLGRKTSSRRSTGADAAAVGELGVGKGGDILPGSEGAEIGGGGGGANGRSFFSSLRRTWIVSAVAPQNVPLQAQQPLYDTTRP